MTLAVFKVFVFIFDARIKPIFPASSLTLSWIVTNSAAKLLLSCTIADAQTRLSPYATTLPHSVYESSFWTSK